MILYSYCLRYDDGAAPNPYWGVCTLAICKPSIRRKAKAGDWVVGLGSKRSPIHDISQCLVYAMKVTKVLSIREYDSHCKIHLPGKIPDWTSSDFRRRVGDCIYDFSHPGPKLRPGVHKETNRTKDLSGLSVLLSKHFYYFGDSPVRLPEFLRPIIHSTQGHKSHANAPYNRRFVDWIERFESRRNRLVGQPQLKKELMSSTLEGCRAICSQRDQKEEEQTLDC